MMGFGLPDDNLHAPNEKFHLSELSSRHRVHHPVLSAKSGEGVGVTLRMSGQLTLLAGGRSSRNGQGQGGCLACWRWADASGTGGSIRCMGALLAERYGRGGGYGGGSTEETLEGADRSVLVDRVSRLRCRLRAEMEAALARSRRVIRE